MPEDPQELAQPKEGLPEEDAAKRQKKKDKVRSAWISFIGRIVAQVVGAVASILLGVLVLQKYQQSGKEPADPQAAKVAEQNAPRVIPARKEGEVALAVLPLDNFSADPGQDYFADGMTESIIAGLARIDGLRVTSRTSSMHYKGQRKSLPLIAQELAVDLVVEGSVLKAGDRVRVTAQLIDAKTDVHLWAGTYDRSLRDILSIQAEVATAIAKEVKVAVTPIQQERFAQRRTVDPVVYDFYLKGRHAWNLRSPEGFKEATDYFEQAISKDPNFALAYAGLADTYSLVAMSVYGQERLLTAARAKTAAERALALDDRLAEAHTSNGLVRYRYEWDWEGADREFRRALELRPGYVTAHQWYAIFLAEQGRDNEAVAQAQRAVSLDPWSATMHMSLGMAHYHARRFDLAVASLRRALELDPKSLARRFLAASFIAQGKFQPAIEICESAPAPVHPQLLATLGQAYARSGDRQRANEIRQQLLARPVLPSSALVLLNIGLGDHDAVFRAMDGSAAERSDLITTLRVDPVFDPVRKDPRFAELLKRLRLG